MKVLIMLISCYSFSFANIFDIKSYQANFQQIVTNNSQKEILYNGKIFLNNTGDILWKYTDPLIKNVFISKKEVIIDEPELEQVIITKMDKSLNLIKILKESTKINANTYENTINKTKYIIKTKNNKLKTIMYTDSIDNKVKINFTNAKLNKQIKSSMFKFTAPLHYDIIRK